MTITTCDALSDTTDFAWRVEQGERETIHIPILDSDNAEYLIDGWEVDATIKDRPGGTVLYTWPGEQITVNGNIIELVVPAAVSLTWTWTVGWWRVKITDPTSDENDPTVYRVIQGPFVVEPD